MDSNDFKGLGTNRDLCYTGNIIVSKKLTNSARKFKWIYTRVTETLKILYRNVHVVNFYKILFCIIVICLDFARFLS